MKAGDFDNKKEPLGLFKIYLATYLPIHKLQNYFISITYGFIGAQVECKFF